jgi:hypothetical protein
MGLSGLRLQSFVANANELKKYSFANKVTLSASFIRLIAGGTCKNGPAMSGPSSVPVG